MLRKIADRISVITKRRYRKSHDHNMRLFPIFEYRDQMYLEMLRLFLTPMGRSAVEGYNQLFRKK